MSNSSTIVLTVLAAGIALRVVLDLSSLSRASRVIDLAYGVLFLSIAVFVMFIDAPDLWALLMAVVSIWYLFRGIRAYTIRPGDGEG